MKKEFLSSLFLLIVIGISAQDNKVEVELKDLVVPSTPAFSLLDFNPKTIERPGTIKALGLNLVNETGKSLGIPKNFGLEFAPYWFFKNANMDIYNYNGIKQKEDGSMAGQNIFSGLKSTSLSLGSVFKDSSKALPVDVNYFAFGVRSNIISIRHKKVLDSIYQRVININRALSTALGNIDCSNFEPGSLEYLQCLGNKLTEMIKKDDVLKKFREEYVKLTEIRPLFSVDLALSSSIAFGNNSFSNSKSYRSGGWLTLAFCKPLTKNGDIDKLLKNKNYINAYAMLRLMSENSTADFKTFNKQHFFDAGGRLEFEFNKFALSLESLHRSKRNSKLLNANRTVGIIQYRLTENFYFLGTFGKSFEKVKNLVALFGLNFGFGSNSVYQKFKQ
jgi:hypothetical protein